MKAHRFFRIFIIMALSVFVVAPMFVAAQPAPVGQWDFNDANNRLKATVGADLQIMGGDARVVTGINAQDGAVSVPTGVYYLAETTDPNGGGGYVNQYTLVFDARIPAFGAWYSFYNTNWSNTNDGEVFISPEGLMGVGATGYSTTAVPEGVWTRFVISVDLAAGYMNYYVDGSLLLATTGRSVDDRFSLYSTAQPDNPWVVLLGDDNGDDAEIEVSAMALFAVGLTPAEVADLGKAGAPIVVKPHEAQPSSKPSIISISPENPSGVEDITLTASPFFSPTGQTHSTSTWQLSFDPSFVNSGDQSVMLSVTSDSALTQYIVENNRIPFYTPVYARVRYVDSNGAVSEYSDPVSFTLAEPAGMIVKYEEDFESTELNAAPQGWKTVTLTQNGDDLAADMDYYNPQLAGWSVQTEETMRQLVYYPSYAGDTPSVNQIGTPINDGKFLIADSGNYAAYSLLYEAYVLTPVYDFSNASDVILSFSSNYVQNQNNIASLEYSLDGGDFSEDLSVSGTWKPLAYYLEPADIIRNEDGAVNVLDTLE
ncbi:MAG: hypothetical protein GC154_21375 [bacterium]|nr:hypothetical protein [bacterium]